MKQAPVLFFPFILLFAGFTFCQRADLATTADLGIYGWIDPAGLGSEDTLNCGGRATVKIKQNTQHYGFFRFDLSSIPATATITSCSLAVRHNLTDPANPFGIPIEISTIVDTWVEGTGSEVIQAGSSCALYQQTPTVPWLGNFANRAYHAMHGNNGSVVNSRSITNLPLGGSCTTAVDLGIAHLLRQGTVYGLGLWQATGTNIFLQSRESGLPARLIVNYTMDPVVVSRSIGTNATILSSIGTASVTAGSNVVTFGGVTLPPNIGEGDSLVLNSTDIFFIKSRDNGTQVTIQGFALASRSAVAYRIRRAFNTMQAWENACPANLVTVNQVWKGVCYKDGVFTGNCTIQGTTTDSLHYKWLTVAPGHRHSGRPGTGVIVDRGGANADFIFLGEWNVPYDKFTIVEWLEIKDGYGTSGDCCANIHFRTTDCTVRNNLFYNTVATGMAIHTHTGNNAFRNRIYNNIFYNMGVGVWDLSGSGNGNQYYNNTFFNCVTAVNNNSGFGVYSNNIALGGTARWTGMTNATGSNNAGGGADNPPGAVDVLTTPDATFADTSAAALDLHLNSTSACRDAGVSLASIFTNDIDDTVRPVGAAWDIGADEYRQSDVTPPSDVTNLAAGTATISAIPLTWTKSVSTDAVRTWIVWRTDGTYPAGPNDPSAAGRDSVLNSVEAYTLNGLPDNTTYYIKVFVRDNVSNWSPGVQVSASTLNGPPSNPLSFVLTSLPTASSISYRINGGASLAGDVNDVYVWVTAVKADILNKNTASADLLIIPKANLGNVQTRSGLTAATKYYVGVVPRDAGGNWSPVTLLDSVATAITNPVTMTLSKNDALEEVYVQFANVNAIGASVDRVYIFYRDTGFVTNPQLTADVSYSRAEFVANFSSAPMTVTGLSKGTWYFSMSLGIGSGRSPITAPDDSLVVDFSSPPNFFTLQFDAVRSVDTLSYFIMEYDTFTMDTTSPVDTLVDSVVILLAQDSSVLRSQFSTNGSLRYASLYKDAVRDVVGYRHITGLSEGGRYFVGVATRNRAGNWSRNVTIYTQYTIFLNPLDVGLAWTPALGDSGIVVTFLNVGSLHASADSVKLFFSPGSYSTNPNLVPERKYSRAELLSNNARTIGGFLPNRPYYFTVTGGNNQNTTGFARITPPPAVPNNGETITTGPWVPPLNPLSFIDTVVTDTSISFRLSGSLPSEVESVYVYYGGTAGDSLNIANNFRSLTPWRRVPASAFSGPYTITGLTQGTNYWLGAAVKSVEKFWCVTAKVSPRIRTHYTPITNALALDSLTTVPLVNRITVHWRWTQGALPARIKLLYRVYNTVDDTPTVHNQAGYDFLEFTPAAASGDTEIVGGMSGLSWRTPYIVSGWVMGSNAVWSLTDVWKTVTTPGATDTIPPSTSFYGPADLVMSCAQVDVRHVRVSWTLSDAAADAASAAERGKLRLGYGYSTSGADPFFNGTYGYSLFVDSVSLKTVKSDTVELLLSQVAKTCYFGVTPVDSVGNAAPALARFIDTFTTVVPAMDTARISAVETGYRSFRVNWQPAPDTNLKYVTIVATDTGFYTGAFPTENYVNPAGTWLAAKYGMSACSTEITALYLNIRPVYVSVFTSVEFNGFASPPVPVDTVHYPLDDPAMPLLRLAQVSDSMVRVDFRVTDGMENSVLLVTRRLAPVPGNPSLFTEAAFPADASDPAYVNLALDTIVRGPSGWTDQTAYIRLDAASLSANRFIGTDDSVLRLKFVLSDRVPDGSEDTAFTALVAIDRKGPSHAVIGVDYDRSTATAVCSVKTDSAGDLRHVYYGRSSSSYPDTLEYVSAGSFVRFTVTGTDSVFVRLADTLGNATDWSWRDFVKDSLFFGDFIGKDTSVDNRQVIVYQSELGVIGAYQDKANLWIGRSRLDAADSAALSVGGFSMVSSQKYWFFTQMMTVYVEGTTIYDEGLDITFRFDEGAAGFDTGMAVYRVVRTGPSSEALEYVGGAAGRDAVGPYVKLEDFRMTSLADTYALVLALDNLAPVIDYGLSNLDFVRADTSVRLTLSVSDNTADLDARIRIFTFGRTGLPEVMLDTATSALRGLSGPSLSCTVSVTVRAGGFYNRMDSAGVFCAVYVKDRFTRYFYGSDTLMHDSLSGEFKLVENQWKLVSLPYAVLDVNSLDFLKDMTNFPGGYDRGRLRLYAEPGTGRAFREYVQSIPPDDAFTVSPGRSFLLAVRYGDDASVGYRLRRAYQALPEKSSGYVFTGDSAWRLVSMPFSGRVHVSSALRASVTARTDLSLRLFRLVGSTNSFTAMVPNEFLPMAGDGFLAYLFPGERLVIPVVDDPVFLPAAKGVVGKASGFTLNLVLRERAGGGVLDPLNVMGVGTAGGLALRDLEMPGSPVRTGFAGKSGLLCVDRRDGAGRGEVFSWSAEELDGAGKEAEAWLEGLSSVPAGLEVWLNDCAAGFSRDLRACEGRFAFVLKGREKRRFEVLVGDKAFVRGRLLDAPPASFALSQNYPNPFNPVTTVSFAVPDLSKDGLLARTRLTLEIYDVRGALVRRLLDAPAQAGYYRVPWNGRSAAGRAVSTGIYVVRMAVTDASGGKRFESVRKMLMVK